MGTAHCRRAAPQSPEPLLLQTGLIMFRARYQLHLLLPSCSVLLASQLALAASWQEGVNYGGSTNMNLYVPDSVEESPGVVVALHSCGNPYEGDSRNYVQSSADQYGFIIIQPTNGPADCWTANAGQDGEKPDIVRMVDHVIDNHNADAGRVFAVGASSGACMTLALLATHPDVFAAGSALAAVPYGAWTGGANCAQCSQQPSMMSEADWGNIVRQNAPADYSGPWPRVQLWHGTDDNTLRYGWLAESEKQWKDVHGVSPGTSAEAPGVWERTEYSKDGSTVLQVNSGPGLGHYLPSELPQSEIVGFFGLDEAPEPDPTGTGDMGSTDEGTGGASSSDGTPSGAGGAGAAGATTPADTTGAAGASGGATGATGGATGATDGATGETGGLGATGATGGATGGGGMSPPGSSSPVTPPPTTAPAAGGAIGATPPPTAGTAGAPAAPESTSSGGSSGCQLPASPSSKGILSMLIAVGAAAALRRRRTNQAG